MCNIAPPLEWSRYATANIIMKTLRNKEPQILHRIITETLYTERRKPLNGKFYDNSHGKIGKKRLCNRIHFMNGIHNEWLLMNITDSEIRIMLKENLFEYCKVPVAAEA